MNNTSCSQLKVVPEPEVPVPRGKEWQHGVGITRAVWQYQNCFVNFHIIHSLIKAVIKKHTIISPFIYISCTIITSKAIFSMLF